MSEFPFGLPAHMLVRLPPSRRAEIAQQLTTRLVSVTKQAMRQEVSKHPLGDAIQTATASLISAVAVFDALDDALFTVQVVLIGAQLTALADQLLGGLADV